MINARKKIMDAISEKLVDFKKIETQELNEEELDEKLSNIIGCVNKTDNMYGEFLESGGKAYMYENGLTYIASVFTYQKNSNENKIMQYTLINNESELPIFNIILNKCSKSMAQLFIDNSSLDSNIPSSGKDVEVETIEINLGGVHICKFTSYKDLHRNQVVLEKYRKITNVSEYSFTDLLRLCGYDTRDLEIIYNNEKPIYAELSSDYSVREARYNPDSKKDVNCIVGIINNEVCSIILKINTMIDKKNRDKDVKIKQKKNSTSN